MEGIIGVTYRCNAHCAMCHIWKHPTEPEDEIRIEHLEKLPEMAFANITGGEPFLRKDIEEIVEVIGKKSKRVVISTNGYFTERIVDLARRHRDIGIRISIEGLPKANDELRGIADGFDRGLRTLLALRHIGLRDIGFGITVSDRNVKDLTELYELAEAMRVEFATAVVHNSYYFHKMDNVIEDKEAMSEEFGKLVRRLLKSNRVKNWYRAYFNHGVRNYIAGGRRFLPCGAGTDLFYVDPVGEVRPCNAMEVTMGNIKEKSFEEIWTGEEAKKIREMVSKCDRNCWMIGSVAPAIKKSLWKTTMWVLKYKFFRRYK